jgi:hypothetical protein
MSTPTDCTTCSVPLERSPVSFGKNLPRFTTAVSCSWPKEESGLTVTMFAGK